MKRRGYEMKMGKTVGSLVALCLAGVSFGQTASDDCASAPQVTGSTTVAFDLTNATNDGTATCGASAANRDVWVKYHSGAAGTAIFSLCGGASFDTVLTVFDGCGGTQLNCNDDYCGLQSQISLVMSVGQDVWIRISVFGSGAGGSGTLTITAPTPPQPGTWFEANDGGGDAGDLSATAQAVTGSGPCPAIVGNIVSTTDVDMYRINICDPGNFSATTVNNDTSGDTQLFLFNDNGTGIVMNDDDPSGAGGLRSRLSNAFTASLSPGTYLLAVSRYNTDPQDSGAQLLWNNTPFAVERAPDGPGAANPVASWTGTSATGSYTITLTGVCRGAGGPRCVADINNDQGVDIQDLVAFLVGFEDGNASVSDLDNGTRTGTQDGAVDINDLIYFLIRFEAGC